MHKNTDEIEANLASDILFAPIRLPTLVAAARPTDKDITKKKINLPNIPIGNQSISKELYEQIN